MTNLVAHVFKVGGDFRLRQRSLIVDMLSTLILFCISFFREQILVLTRCVLEGSAPQTHLCSVLGACGHEFLESFEH